MTWTDAPTATNARANFAASSVSLTGVRKVFPGDVVAVENIDLRIDAGEFVALIGPSGCGKSTLLRLIAGLDAPTSGKVTVSTASAPLGLQPHRSIAYVFQDAHLLPWRTVFRNVELPLELMKVPKADRVEPVRKAIAAVGLSDAEHRYPAQLSGGMRMRVSLARAMVTEPALLLLDEPFAALDEITRQHLDEQLRALWLERRMTVLFVTHSIAEAAYLAERAIVFSKRPARIVLDQAVALPTNRPASLRGEAVFASQTHTLFQALERGGRI